MTAGRDPDGPFTGRAACGPRCNNASTPALNSLNEGEMKMRKLLMAVFCAGALVAGSDAADAKGCIRGALIGGIAGHLAGHGVAGAAAGCAVGSGASHYMKSHTSRSSLQRDQQQLTPPAVQ